MQVPESPRYLPPAQRGAPPGALWGGGPAGQMHQSRASSWGTESQRGVSETTEHTHSGARPSPAVSSDRPEPQGAGAGPAPGAPTHADGVDVGLVAGEGLPAHALPHVPQLGRGVAGAGDEQSGVRGEGQAHHVPGVPRERGGLLARLDVPQSTGAGDTGQAESPRLLGSPWRSVLRAAQDQSAPACMTADRPAPAVRLRAGEHPAAGVRPGPHANPESTERTPVSL